MEQQGVDIVREFMKSPIAFLAGFSFALYIGERVLSIVTRVKNKNSGGVLPHMRCIDSESSKQAVKNNALTLQATSEIASTLIRNEAYLKTLTEKSIETVTILRAIELNGKR